MSLSLTVDGERWRSHLLRTVRTHPGIVPVAKGNGYGLSGARHPPPAPWRGRPRDATRIEGFHPSDDIDPRRTRQRRGMCDVDHTDECVTYDP